MQELMKRLKADKSGASAAEYALIIALIAAAIVLGMATLSGVFTGAMDKVETDAGL